MSAPLLSVDALTVRFPTLRGPVEVVKGISFAMGRERFGIVGESGSGKSMTGRAIMRLIRPPGEVTADSLSFDGQNLMALSDQAMRDLRGARLSMILQDPKFSLNPVMSVGEQIGESLTLRARLSRAEKRERIIAMLEAVHIREPARVAGLYPHELSGGMGQRVMIAMMLIAEPDLLIADEPTSALDVSVQAEVLGLIDELVNAKGMGLILISHDLPLVARYCDRLIVMQAGRIVESCKASDLSKATHPYTRGMLGALPRMNERRKRLPVIDRTALEGT